MDLTATSPTPSPEAQRAETLQQRSAHLLDIVASMTGLGAWELAVDSMTPLWSSHARQIFGLDPSGPLDLEDILECYAAEARPLMQAAFREAVANGKPFDLTLPAVHRNGSRLWVRCVGDPEVADERTLRVSGAVQDVTRQHEADLRLKRASRLSFQGHWEYDFGTDQVWCSAAYQQLLGHAPQERRVPAATFHAETWPGDEAAVTTAFARHIAEGTPYDVQLRLKTASGQWRWFRRRGAVEHDELGRITSLTGQLIDIHDERLAVEEAAAANRAKSDFLANMSHEIRTPMNGVLGMTELLLETSLNPVQHEYAETIRTSATSLLGILNDILDF